MILFEFVSHLLLTSFRFAVCRHSRLVGRHHHRQAGTTSRQGSGRQRAVCQVDLRRQSLRSCLHATTIFGSVIHLSGVAAPRLGSMVREDEVSATPSYYS